MHLKLSSISLLICCYSVEADDLTSVKQTTLPPIIANQVISLENVGLGSESAPANKYTGESTLDEPEFIDDNSSPDGGDAANVPLASYIMTGFNLDQQSAGRLTRSNGGTVPFTDNNFYIMVGTDKKLSSDWVVGGYLQQKRNFPIQQNNADNPENNGYFAANNSTEGRVQGVYSTSFGLVNAIRLDLLSGVYGGSANVPFEPTLRIEDFIRYTTQYNKTFYQFTGGRFRYRTNKAWDTRGFIGQGFQFSPQNTYEISFIQELSKIGNANGSPLLVFDSDGNSFFPGIVSKQYLTNSYTHVFRNKTSLNLNANLVGSTYYTSNYQIGFEVEIGYRIPF